MKRNIRNIVISVSLGAILLVTSSSTAWAGDKGTDNIQEYVLYSKDLVTGEEGYEDIPISDDFVLESMSGNIFEDNNDSGISPNAYIGEDDSYEIFDTYSMPYKAVCNLKTYWDNNGDGIADFTAGGSGCMVGRTVLLTAGHVIYNTGWGKCVGVDVYPAQMRYYTPYGPYTAKKIFVNVKLEEEVFSNGKDWGIVIMNNPVGDTTGWLNLKNCTDVDMIGEDVSVIGYPGGKDPGRITMWRSDGKVIGQGTYPLYYDCDTAGGNSGSPVINSDNEIVAVHSGGTTDVHNVGAKVVSDLYSTVNYMRYTYD